MSKWFEVVDGVIKSQSFHEVNGWLQGPDDWFPGYESDGNDGFVAPASPAPTSDDVNAYRNELIEAGKSFTVTGYGEVSLAGREADKIVYITQRMFAKEAKSDGITSACITLRDNANQNHLFTPDQAIELFNAAIAWVEAVMQVSWDMKDAVGDFDGTNGKPLGIPTDPPFTDDSWWPQ